MTASVPGNLLLLGEYAVLEEGGLGLALAVEPRARVEIHPRQPGAAGLLIEGAWGGRVARWTPARPDGAPLFDAVLRACGQALRARGGTVPAQGWIGVDSSAFFTGPGRKSGFGSSAAVSMGLAWAVLRLAGLSGAGLAEGALEAALDGHRLSQGGRGSGYDVYASFHGGFGLFTGGRRPRWQPWRPRFRPRMRLLHGPGSVSTVSSVRLYDHWKSREPSAAAEFLRLSNRHVLGFAHASSWTEAVEHLREAAELGIRLGRAIGVEARFPGPSGPDGPVLPTKSLGAGNELAVLMVPAGPDGPPAAGEPLEPAPEGLTWTE